VRQRFPWLRYVFADGRYAGDTLRDALAISGSWTIETTIASSTAWATIASFRMITRRTARYCYT
jgi:hypothetical protein